MEKCFLCPARAEIEKRADDSSYVLCSGECGPGPYLISRLERNNVTGGRGKKIPGRKQNIFKEVRRLRMNDPDRLILIRDGKVGFEDSF